MNSLGSKFSVITTSTLVSTICAASDCLTLEIKSENIFQSPNLRVKTSHECLNYF